MGQQRENTAVAVGGPCTSEGARQSTQSQTNGVDADGRRIRVDSHLPSTTVPGISERICTIAGRRRRIGHLDTGTVYRTAILNLGCSLSVLGI